MREQNRMALWGVGTVGLLSTGWLVLAAFQVPITFLIQYGLYMSFWYGFCLLASCLAVLLLHELGHLLAGWALSWKLKEIQAGSWKLERIENAWKWMHTAAFSCNPSITMIPDSADPSAAARIFYDAGGILANLLSAALMEYGLISCSSVWLYLLGRVFVILSVAFACINLLCISTPDFQSDGCRIFHVLRQRKTGAA